MNALALVFAALACLTLGAGLARWRAGARRPQVAAAARRSHVLYALAEGDLENVAQELEQIAEAEPGDATVFLALAALDRRRGRVERAKAIHRTVLAAAELAPELRVAALVGLGRDLLAQGQQDAAVGALSRAISLAPQSVATLESLARALEQAGAWERAAAARIRNGARIAYTAMSTKVVSHPASRAEALSWKLRACHSPQPGEAAPRSEAGAIRPSPGKAGPPHAGSHRETGTQAVFSCRLVMAHTRPSSRRLRLTSR